MLGEKPIKVANSLNTSEKKELVELVLPTDREVLWYQCGPTVYDVSHLGHARTYVALDCIRRIIEQYFGYKVKLVQNVTDIDDKIINKFIADQAGAKEYSTFQDISRRFEQLFNDDMANLGVLPPDDITRVSEYMPEIVRFIQALMTKGFAYCGPDGSVYFDVHQFTKTHKYGKLEPGSVTVTPDDLPESERPKDGRKRAEDFALWKVKAEEAVVADTCSWDPAELIGEELQKDANGRVMGRGRPGWHIECSVMASDKLCTPERPFFDIHCGGIDLRFPHHDNELAQSEAYWGCQQWVNYFFHTGSLTVVDFVDGNRCVNKMSKSLGNFVTIADTLRDYTPTQVRLMLLNSAWNVDFQYQPALLETAAADERKLRVVLSELASFEGTAAEESVVAGLVAAARQQMDDDLRNNFRYDRTLARLFSLIREYDVVKAKGVLDRTGAEALQAFILEVLGLLGVEISTEKSGPDADAAQRVADLRAAVRAPALESKRSKDYAAGAEAIEALLAAEENAEPAVGEGAAVLTELIASIRKAIATPDEKLPVAVLAACDATRERLLRVLGVSVQDKTDGAGYVLQWLSEAEKKQELDIIDAKRRKEEAKALAKKVEAELQAALLAIPVGTFFLQAREAYQSVDHKDKTNVNKTYADVVALYGPGEDAVVGLPKTKSVKKKVFNKETKEKTEVLLEQEINAKMLGKYAKTLAAHGEKRVAAGLASEEEKALVEQLGQYGKK
ncbi:Cysteinyl-tRNA synthetase/mycothiol ligase [Carpediemonas membranifera]|uniref:cysteine--tRNA ligase n=1 Tax=Carpediemonas membranifera TaxID=201153 RepID=A0A8J6E847_9EUKA|nr:Cysteinyl-tRNA synthetase/mycothiol ligase [Carpediemonas membranifera]|eukprot:KAG9391420.1 Cysteinyl-tRNA synthetase/mycothiol ligase [Carpediemonas membranifera]